MGRAGLGSFPKSHYYWARNKGKHQLVQDEIRTEVEEEYYSKMVSMSKQDVGKGGSRWNTANFSERALGSWISVPDIVCSWCLLNPSQPAQTVPEAGQLGAHPELLPSGVWGGAVLLAPQSSSKSLGRFYLHSDTKQPQSRQSPSLEQEREQTNSPPSQEGSSSLLATGGFNVTWEGTWRWNSNHFSPPRYGCNIVWN